VLLRVTLGMGAGLMDVSSVHLGDPSFQALAAQDIWAKSEAAEGGQQEMISAYRCMTTLLSQDMYRLSASVDLGFISSKLICGSQYIS
jgi:hypothetical protein